MKILEPGHPGDLMMIFTQAAKSIEQLQQQQERLSEEQVSFQLFRIASAAVSALLMWLGILAVPDDGKPIIHEAH